MNYIELINNFWNWYDNNKDKLSTSEIALYFVLLRYCNRLNWTNPFNVNPYLMLEINPLSINTYYKSLKVLNDCKLIKWEKGKFNVTYQNITILKIKNSLVNSPVNSLMNSPTNSLVNSLVSNNKTIKLINNINNINTDLIYFSLKNETINGLTPFEYCEQNFKTLIESYLMNFGRGNVSYERLKNDFENYYPIGSVFENDKHLQNTLRVKIQKLSETKENVKKEYISYISAEDNEWHPKQPK